MDMSMESFLLEQIAAQQVSVISWEITDEIAWAVDYLDYSREELLREEQQLEESIECHMEEAFVQEARVDELRGRLAAVQELLQIVKE